MLRNIALRPSFIARLATFVERNPAGTRRAVFVGALLGLAWALPGRLWMRLITDKEPQFTVAGTLFIFIVVSGFGAAAGYAFARRGKATRRFRRWFDRALAFIPVAGLGPGLIFFVPGVAFAIAAARRNSRRWLRIALLVVGCLSGAFWTLVMLSNDRPLATVLIYLLLGYLVYVALRFALEPRTRSTVDQYDPFAYGEMAGLG